MMNAQELPSTRPYLIRALYEWCADNGYTPYLVVRVNESVQVPREYVNNGEIVLNVSYDATSGLQIGNDFVEFKARFGGTAREIMVPIDRVIAIYARENGQGMAFPVPVPTVGDEGVEGAVSEAEAITSDANAPETPRNGIQLVTVAEAADDDEGPGDPPSPPPRKRPALKRVK